MKIKYTIQTLAIASLAIAINPIMAGDKTSAVPGDQSWSSGSGGDVARVSEDYLDQISTAKNILGSSVYDGAGEKIGDVKDISLGYKLHSVAGLQGNDKSGKRSSDSAIDSNKNHLEDSNSRYATNENANNRPGSYVFISVGGLMGIGDDVVRVPMSSLTRSAEDKDHLVLQGYSKENIVAIAEQEAGDFDASDYEYDRERSTYSRTDRSNFGRDELTRNQRTDRLNNGEKANAVTSDADNTDRNLRDRNDRTLTPMDQGNSKADTATTASIRKEINATQNPSINGKNVKVITKDGKVTLRGPVNSAEEKRLIGEIANRIARAANVDNQLEVAVATSSI
ncbi:BON domain-containing protein [Pelagicoccus sp. SDUM812003]|uniref:BON domain-containing protein n=1 Tax=Pelagicoccus sp. SDUM812003 TaxID=3041267 RepID=UPI00280FACA9|nr:BON domain-containing protein [Pelagicoccus sp. SDUM812003]MDQ8204729.1 BON domain-containing protein [Pelagicoccus sp. SDUM812003]